MKIHMIVLTVIDFDGLGADGVTDVLVNTRYANDCISPDVLTVVSKDIGDWSDDHPLNHRSTSRAEIDRLFGAKT